MSLYVHFSPKSINRKLGGLPCSTSSANTCAPSCPLKKGGCYGHSWPLSHHWREVSAGRRGTDWSTFCSKIADLDEGTMWRHNVAGDLPHERGVIDQQLLSQLVEANQGKSGFMFTHHEPNGPNCESILWSNQQGLTINMSANSLGHADELASLNIAPVAALVFPGETEPIETPAGRPVQICPAQEYEDVTCAKCGACCDPLPGLVVGFKPHGCQRRIAERIAMGLSEQAFSNE